MAAQPQSSKATAKPTSTKKEFLLFLSIPAGIILLVSLFLFVPTLLAKPGYDFIYTQCPDYDCSSTIVLGKDGLKSRPEISTEYNNYRLVEPEIYYHDTGRNASKRIDLNEANKYVLDASNVSPDGYTLTRGTSDGGFLFWGYSSDSNWYLKKGSLQKKSLNLADNDYYSRDIKLMGWVEK